MAHCFRLLRIGLLWLGFLVFSTLMVNILISIAARYLGLPIANIDWVEETSRFLFIWLSFLGAALAVERMVHIRIDFFAKLLPPRLRLLLEILVYTAMVAFSLVAAYEGALVTARAADRSPVLFIPMSYAYLALPVSGVAIALFALRILIDLIARFSRGEDFSAEPGEVTAEVE